MKLKKMNRSIHITHSHPMTMITRWLNEMKWNRKTTNKGNKNWNPCDKIMCWFSSSFFSEIDGHSYWLHAYPIHSAIWVYLSMSFYADHILWFNDCLLSHVLFVSTAPPPHHTKIYNAHCRRHSKRRYEMWTENVRVACWRCWIMCKARIYIQRSFVLFMEIIHLD